MPPVAQAPNPIPVPLPQKKSPLLVISLIVGIISIVVAWFWMIALPLAVLAIVLGVIGHRKQKENRMWVAGVATGSIGIVFSVVAAGLWLLLSGFMAQAGDTPYSTAVDELRNSQTSFNQNETAKFGPIDVKVVSVEDANQTATGKDVVVTLKVSASKNPVGDGVQGDDWTGNLAAMELNGKAPSSVDFPDSKTGYMPGMRDLDEDGPQTVVLTYRVYTPDVQPAGENTLKYDATYFTKVSWLVGTEGMPHEGITYTIKLDH